MTVWSDAQSCLHHPIFCQIQHLVSALKALCRQRGWGGTLVVTIYICWVIHSGGVKKKWFDTMPCISGARSCFLPESRAPCPPFSGWNPGNIKKSSNVFLIPCPCSRNIDKCDTKIQSNQLEGPSSRKHLCCTILALGYRECCKPTGLDVNNTLWPA